MPMATLIYIWKCFQLRKFESKGPYYMNCAILQMVLDQLMAIKSMNVDLDYYHISWRDWGLLVILLPLTSKQMGVRAGSDYGQTLRGEPFGPMKMHKCPKSVLSAFTLEAKVQRTSPPKEPRWHHF
jgi:hypothetical protein